MILFNFNDLPYISECNNHINNFDILVTDYIDGYYDGSGTAVGIKDDFVYIFNLSHCSCYGPFEGDPECMSLKNYLESAMVSVPDNVFRKTVELLNQKNKIESDNDGH